MGDLGGGGARPLLPVQVCGLAGRLGVLGGGGALRRHLVRGGQAGDRGGRGRAGARHHVQVPVLAGDRCVGLDLGWLQVLGELAGVLGVLGGGVAGGECDVIRAASQACGVLVSVK